MENQSYNWLCTTVFLTINTAAYLGKEFQQMQIHFLLARVKLSFQSSGQIKRWLPDQDALPFKRIGHA